MSPEFGGAILALDSSTATGSAAVGTVAGPLAEVVLSIGPGHSASLLPAADQAMRMAGVAPEELKAIVVGGGPGSFTGVRIAAAMAKGMGQALGIPLLAYSGLLAAATTGWGATGPVCALFDARRRDVFAASYHFGRAEDRGDMSLRAGRGSAAVQTVLEPAAMSLDELIARLRRDPPALLVGDGALLHRAELERELGSPVMPSYLGLPRASGLLWLAFNAGNLATAADATAWEPDYLRAAGAERIAAANHVASEPARK